jgi:AraC-like DNA-binding protein
MRRSPIALYGHWPAAKHRRLPAHRNPGLEVVLIVRGMLTWHVEGRVEAVPAGSVFFTLPWETHGSTRRTEPGCELFFVVLRLDRAHRRATRAFAFHRALGLSPTWTGRVRRALLDAPRRAWPATARLTMAMPELIDEMRRREVCTDATVALSRLVLIELERSIRGEGVDRPRPAAEQRVRAFMARLPDECHRPWTLAAMADTCGLGRSRFTALMESLAGDSPMRALSRARIERAQRLLQTTAWPITRIALACGYGSSQHFAGVFKAYAGCTSSEFRVRAAKKA